MAPLRHARTRHLRHAAAVSLVATAGILGTYLGSPRIPQAYARPGAPFETMFTGNGRPGLGVLREFLPGTQLRASEADVVQPWELPYDVTCDFSVDDSTGLHAAIRSSRDDSVICIVNDIPDLSDQLIIDDTSLIIIGAAGDDSTTNVTLTADDTRHIHATFDDTEGFLALVNITFTGGTVDDSGGSVFIDGTRDPSQGTLLYLVDDTFTANVAGGSGGAIYAKDVYELITGGEDYTRLSGSVFESNVADGDGGALYALNAERVLFYGSSLTANYAAGSGGAVAVRSRDEETLIGVIATTFTDDSAGVQGGAIAASGVDRTAAVYAFGLPDLPTIFSGNSAPSGGAIWVGESGSGGAFVWTLGALRMTGNTATGGDGGAVLVTSDDTNSSPSPGPGPFGAQLGFLSFGFNYFDLYSDLTPVFSDNSATGDGGAIHVTGVADAGGLILANYVTPFSTGSTFSGNSAGGQGGAMFVDGTALVRQSAFVGNTSGSHGGAIAVDDSTSVINPFPYQGTFVYGGYFAGNSSTDPAGKGGAIYVHDNAGELVTLSSTFTRNSAYLGGALASYDDTIAVNNSTFTQNTAVSAGAIVAGGLITGGSVYIDFSTITDNYASGYLGGVLGRTVTVTNSIVQRNRAGGIVPFDAPAIAIYARDVVGIEAVDDSFSIFTSPEDVFAVNSTWSPGTGSLFTNQPVVGALGNNGGFVVGDDTVIPTMLPLAGSPVLDAANPSVTGSPTTYDERGPGFLRVSGSRADMGAVERVFTPQPVPTPASPPRDVTAEAGNGEVTVTWEAPASSGSFPVSNYRAVATIEGQDAPQVESCIAVAPTLTCTITGLTNGTTYTVRVQALTGAGWSALSQPSEPVTPEAPILKTIVISGTRERVEGKQTVFVNGTTTGLVGETVKARVRLQGQPNYSNGSTRVVDEAGEFIWQRITGKRTYVYFVAEDGSVRSNRIIIRR